IDEGRLENIPAPQIAIEYWQLPASARLRDVVIAVREDEAGHRDRNHYFADTLIAGDEPSAEEAAATAPRMPAYALRKT
ncbi:MAG: alternative oxidase, partial [Pseudomonadota bacterium]